MNLNYYTEYWESLDDDRNTEVINCINQNIASKFFKNIFIFSNKKEFQMQVIILFYELMSI